MKLAFAIMQVPAERMPRGYFLGKPVPPELYEVVWGLDDLREIYHEHVQDGNPPDELEGLLEWVFRKFNVDPPEDFKGHSLSVGDVVKIGDRYFKVEYVGFKEVTELFDNEKVGGDE